MLIWAPANARVQERYEGIYKSLSKGNTYDLYNQLGDIVYIQLDSKSGAYSRKQAKAALDKFFKYNRPYDFDHIIDRYKQETSLTYSIGQLKTSKGKYKVYLLIKVAGNNYQIQQIRFEKWEE